MLCVNSYKQGKVIELRLADGHVLILGRNGAGKTTLAQLIPLFYGVPASHIVDRSGGRSPITEFLLRGAPPTSSSNIGVMTTPTGRKACGPSFCGRTTKAGWSISSSEAGTTNGCS